MLVKQLCGLQTQNSLAVVGSVANMQPGSSSVPLQQALQPIPGVLTPSHPHPLTLLTATAASQESLPP